MSKKKVRQAPSSTETTSSAASTSTPAPAFKRTITGGPADFNPDHSLIIKDLRRIGILAGSFFVILVALSFFLN